MTKLPPDVQPLLSPRRVSLLEAGWRLARTAPGACDDPAALASIAEWQEAQVPGTVAGSLHRDIGQPGDYDAHDWWYRTTFTRPEGARHFLRFDGLATIAQAWLNGAPILESRNMFRRHRVDVTRHLRDQNELVIAFRSLAADLARRRPRPRWKTQLVRDQGLRWARTTLLGRIPAWTPAIAPVGPWRGVAIESADRVTVSDVRLRAWAEGSTGRISFHAALEPIAG